MTRAKRGSKLEPEPENKSSAGKFGRIPGTTLQIGDPDAPTWWQWLDSLTEDEWKRSICYWYRSGPITDRQAQGKPISLEKWGGKFDQTDVVNRHGSGRYRFDFCYVAPGTNKYVRVAQEFETILDMSKPPRVPLGEWIDNPANKDWEWAKALLRAEEVEREQMAAEKIAGKPQPQQSSVEQLKETLDLAKTMLPQDSSQALVLKLLEQSGPANMLMMAKQLAELREPSAGSQNESPMMLLLLKHILEKQLPAPVDPLESTTKLMTGFKGLFESMGLTPNPGTVAGKPDTTSAVVGAVSDVLGKAIEQFAPIIPRILDVVRHVKDRDLQIAQVAAARGMNPAAPYQYVGTPQNPPAPHQPPAVVAPVPVAEPENGPMSPQVFFAKHGGLLQELFPFIADHFNNLDGYDLADFIIERKGLDTYNALRKDASVDMLMTLVNYQPQLRQLFQPVEDAKVFFEELLCDPNNRPPEDEAPEAPESGAAA